MEWKIIFEKAGITEEQLQDKKTAKIVAKFMKQHGAGGGATQPQAAATQPASVDPSPKQPRRAPPRIFFRLNV